MELLRFYVQQNRRHAGTPVYQWLLARAHELGASGGTAFHALAGFGRHGWHSQGFFELAGDVPVAVEIIAPAELLDRLLATISTEQLALPWLRVPVAYGYTGAQASD
ncbi:DUF190 domain-containing protein [Chitinilyticum litopenaei]|uniref:DUF190 domain-containing protein n=1 Tax=Chitinilyticum litopenaei TaxID=1121276 RepID=UPI000401D194|nr:DUF190 domain-containing protein [Chitinilyticum litopenaei]